MRFTDVCLRAFGYELPPRVLSSAAIEERLAPVYRRLKLPAGRLELMSGIRERRLWEPGTRPSEAAALAGARALAAARLPTAEIECLIFASVSRDMLEPASAAFVHRRLNLSSRCLLFDVSNACLGFLDGMVLLAGMIEQGLIGSGLVVAGETAEDLLESTMNGLLADRTVTRKSIKSSFASLTIGSGAAALVMSRASECPDAPRLAGGTFRAESSHNHLCQGGLSPASGTAGSTLMATDSESLLKEGVETARLAWHDFLEETGWPAEAPDIFFCHQVGRAHSRLLFETLDLDPARNFETLENLGNTGSAAAPLTMALGMEAGRFRPGQRAGLLGIGSGINCLLLGIDWPG